VRGRIKPGTPQRRLARGTAVGFFSLKDFITKPNTNKEADHIVSGTTQKEIVLGLFTQDRKRSGARVSKERLSLWREVA
jgi:hypothetical protein